MKNFNDNKWSVSHFGRSLGEFILRIHCNVVLFLKEIHKDLKHG